MEFKKCLILWYFFYSMNIWISFLLFYIKNGTDAWWANNVSAKKLADGILWFIFAYLLLYYIIRAYEYFFHYPKEI